MRFAIWIAALTGCGAPVRPAMEPTADGPVVIELFTSQGCSSCPPADRWLASLRPGDEVGGRPVIPLAFHVDYWNYLGWADPFSSEAWSERQSRYGRVYTPEIVVAGRADAVGSHRREIEDLVAATPPTAVLEATLSGSTSELRIAATAPTGTTVWAAVVEDGLVTDVDAGENAGEALRDDHIVRALVAVDGEARVAREPAWGKVRVVAFAQAADGTIVAARALD